jgi:hypothetical protein
LDVESTVSAGTSYMVWYINTETVEAEAVHNSFNGTYSYSKAGKVVKKNKTK